MSLEKGALDLRLERVRGVLLGGKHPAQICLAIAHIVGCRNELTLETFVSPIKARFDTLLDEMLHHPERWGSAEAYELQVLLLLEIRFDLERHALIDRYVAFLRLDLPNLGARPLSAITTDFTTISRLLARFRQSLDAAKEFVRP